MGVERWGFVLGPALYLLLREIRGQVPKKFLAPSALGNSPTFSNGSTLFELVQMLPQFFHSFGRLSNSDGFLLIGYRRIEISGLRVGGCKCVDIIRSFPVREFTGDGRVADRQLPIPKRTIGTSCAKPCSQVVHPGRSAFRQADIASKMIQFRQGLAISAKSDIPLSNVRAQC